MKDEEFYELVSLVTEETGFRIRKKFHQITYKLMKKVKKSIRYIFRNRKKILLSAIIIAAGMTITTSGAILWLYSLGSIIDTLAITVCAIGFFLPPIAISKL